MLCAISNNIEAKEKYMNKKLTPPISSKVLKDVNRIITAAKDKTKVFVDIDGTIVTEYGEPNQQVLSLMNYLAEKNIDIYLWSAGGEENCRKVAKKYNIEKMVVGYLPKPTISIDDMHYDDYVFLKIHPADLESND